MAACRLMRAHLMALLATSLLLAGCAAGPSEQAASSSTGPAPMVTTVVGQPVPPTLTDSVHLVAYPETTVRAPDSYTDLRIAIPPFNDALTAGRCPALPTAAAS